MDALRFRLRVFLAALICIMVIGAVGFMIVERLSIGDAFYFSIVTISTVGYGDVHPSTGTGKILAVFLIVAGVGTFLGLVATVTEMLLNKREKSVRLEKLNMLIGAFFSEVGTKLLIHFSDCDPKLNKIRKELIVAGDWSGQEFSRVSRRLRNYDYGIDIQKVDLEDLRNFLIKKRNFSLRLLENPTLLEHESFTDLLRAVFHLTEELDARENLSNLPDTDYEHLAGDIKRAYILLVHEWLDYMKYLKDNYPYLFSLAMRTNPFDKNASPVVK